MPIDDFHGETFVCFTDISGFKVLLQHDRPRAIRALDVFYRSGYALLREQTGTVKTEGMFISDCGILFIRPNGTSRLQQFVALLSIVEQLNRSMLREELMLTTSLAFGLFTYESRLEFLGIDKNLILGTPYVEAFLDNEAGSPKLEPGQCRVLRERLPNDLPPFGPNSEDPILSRLRSKTPKHLYFYWMRRRARDIEAFETSYADAYNLKYSGMLRALREPEQ